ncbi:MAG: hypothetical protein HFG68_08135 [Hungatella sp.]|nr:hypothetical protein [Hungatella sp.]
MIEIKLKNPFLYLVLFIFFYLVVFFLYYKFYYIDQTLSELQSNVNIMNSHNNSTTQTEYMQTIDFLENEITKYREFVEKQQNFLIQLIGIFGAVLTGLFAFFKIEGAKDISNIIQEQYTNQVQNEIAHFIGGQDKTTYLIDCIEREKQAKNKKILFLFQNNESKNLMEVYSILKDQKYQVKERKIRGTIVDKEIHRWTNENDIIIYQVDESEFITPEFDPDETVTYARIATECNNKKVYSILYCENNTALKRSLYNSYFYISNANYGLTAMEHIFYLLYLV